MNPRKPPNKGGFSYAPKTEMEEQIMEIFKSGVDLLQLGVTAMGGGAVLMGMLNIFESLSSDNPGPRAQGMRQAFGGGVIVLIGTTLVPMLKTMLG